MATPTVNLGKKVEWHNGSAFIDITALESIEVEYGERETIDTSHLGTATNVNPPFLAGLLGAAIITISGHFDKDDTVHAALLTDYLAGTKRQVRYTRTDATPSTRTWANAMVTSLRETADKSGSAKFTAVIRAEGAPTEA